jgi:hypothetical protein
MTIPIRDAQELTEVIKCVCGIEHQKKGIYCHIRSKNHREWLQSVESWDGAKT